MELATPGAGTGGSGGDVHSLRVLTVGDGDLSYSLALARCYGTAVSLTATTLCSEAELRAKYALAGAHMTELRALGATIIHGVDACTLEPRALGEHEAVIFNLPHLGAAADLTDEAEHARLHGALVAHFLYSARALVLRTAGAIHLTLTGNQVRTWDVEAAALRARLVLATGRPASRPPPLAHPESGALLEPGPTCAEWRARRKYRTGALGGRHFLSSFGYEHRRCEGDAPMMIADATVYTFHVAGGMDGGAGADDGAEAAAARCAVCLAAFGDAHALARHLARPARPADETPVVCPATGRTFASAYALATYRKARPATDEPPAAASPAVEPPAAMSGEDCGERRSATVGDDGEGERLYRWARRCAAFGGHLSSKRACAAAFKRGNVSVNGATAEATRLLRSGDVVGVLVPSAEAAAARAWAGHAHDPVRVLLLDGDVAIGWKPVGMRACGCFAGTLQSALEPLICHVQIHGGPPRGVDPQMRMISRVEPACGAPCLLARSARACDALGVLPRGRRRAGAAAVVHVFTALVHGRAPDTWVDGARLPLPRGRGPRGRRRPARAQNEAAATAEGDDDDGDVGDGIDDVDGDGGDGSDGVGGGGGGDGGDGDEDDDGDDGEDDGDNDGDGEVHIEVLDATPSVAPAALSTLRLTCASRRGGVVSAICAALRHAGVPIVGDRFARREHAALPRACAGVLKPNRLQMGCYELRAELAEPIGAKCVRLDVPQRLVAAHWTARLAEE